MCAHKHERDRQTLPNWAHREPVTINFILSDGLLANLEGNK